MPKVLKFVCLFLSFNSFSCFSSEAAEANMQKNIEISSFFNLLLIPTNETYTNPDWKLFSKNFKAINWLTDSIVNTSEHNQKASDLYSREGRVIFKNNSHPADDVLGKKQELGEWRIELLGTKSFINEVSVKMLKNTPEYNVDIVSILKSNNYSITPYKCDKESEPASSGNVVYSIELSGFKPLWLKDEWSCGSAGCVAYITLYYTKSRADSTECYGS